ncbi:MAG: small multi-drug export protein [Candidatus Saccharibacteria bacterium]|nr:small multi-drug export protein [Candidatus Saccharibacteria bacterium]
MVAAILTTLFVAMVPVIELRGALPIGVGMGLAPLLSAAIAVIGNLIPIPFILILLQYILELMRKWNWSKKMVIWLEKKVEKNRGKVDKYGWWGLMILVAIPLPGTGAWTGALVASCLEMDKKKAFSAITVGVLVAGAIVLALTYGATQLF